MASKFTCPKCKKRLSLGGSSPGQRLRCPQCQTSFTAPDQGAAAEPVPVGVTGASDPGISRLGSYEIQGKLGEGAFGVVYRAYHASLQRHVAIKTLKADALRSPQVRDRFLREARVVAQMVHGNIVPVHDLLELQDGCYIVSAFIPGRSLDASIPEAGMEPARAVRLTTELLAALAYAHERGVLHRDVKPANAMLDDKDHLYLMDFGLAGLLGQDDQRMTKDGAVMGTPAYMAPEQAKGVIREVGPGADQYSAGVVLYELLTGEVPFRAPNWIALCHVIVTVPPRPPSTLRPDVDPELDAICLRALAKEPADRFPSCEDFAAALTRWLAGASQARPKAHVSTEAVPVTRPAKPAASTMHAGPQPTLNVPAPRRSRSSTLVRPSRRGTPLWLWLVLGLVGLLTIAALAATVYLMTSSPKTTNRFQQ